MRCPGKIEQVAREDQTISEAMQSLEPADLNKVREEIAQLVSKHAFEMVLGTIEEAKNGHYAAMKFLFEMTGLYPASGVEKTEEDNGLARLLLARLGISPEPEMELSAEVHGNSRLSEVLMP
jgi:hypothetical protein